MATRGAREEMQDGGRMQEREHGLLCNMHLSHHTILRSDANVPRSTYLFRNFFRAAILYANFYLCSIKIKCAATIKEAEEAQTDALAAWWKPSPASRARHTPWVRSGFQGGARLIEQLS
jgi:hypothetical protein